MIKLTKSVLVENNGKQVKLPAGTTIKVIKEDIEINGNVISLPWSVTDNVIELINDLGFEINSNESNYFVDPKDSLKLKDAIVNGINSGKIGMKLTSTDPMGRTFTHPQYNIAYGDGLKPLDDSSKKLLNKIINALSSSTIGESSDFEKALAKIKPKKH